MIPKFLNGKQSGFTIIEVLVIVVVIAILAGIALVAYPAYQERARDSKRKADLHAIADAYKAAKADKGYDSELGFSILIPNFNIEGSSPEDHPTLAGNKEYPSQPGGTLGELGYLNDTVMDPKWVDPPNIDGSTISYSGYVLIPCLNSDKGFFMATRLEHPDSSNSGALGQLMDEIDTIPPNSSNPTDQNSCFYYKEGYNSAENNPLNGLILGPLRAVSKGLMDGSNGYNYAIYVK